MIVDLLTQEGSWIVPHLQSVTTWCHKNGYNTRLYTNHHDIRGGGVLFILGYLKIVGKDYRDRYEEALVIHESDLPKGRGFAPMSWQIASGSNKITFTLFKADDAVDSGPVYMKRKLMLNGTELFEEWRRKQGDLTVEMVKEFLTIQNLKVAEDQVGEASFYEKRSRKDDELQENLTLAECFDRIRVCDPKNYPAWFQFRGRNFKIILEPLSKKSKFLALQN
jgi:methionyl-tRNA formyltransferase